MDDKAGSYTYLYDGQGNVTQNLRNGKEANSYYYDPFGKTEGGVEANDVIFGYNGEEYTEAAGLQYLRQRHYDPAMGAFLAKDLYRGDLYEPASQDRYSYAENDPVNYNDPGGDKKTSKNPKKSGNGKTSGALSAVTQIAKLGRKVAVQAAVKTAVGTVAKAAWTAGYRAKNRNATKTEAETAYQVAKATGAVLRANETLKAMATKLQTGASCKGRPGAGSAWQGGRPAMPARVQDLSQLTKRDLAKMHDALDMAGLATPAADALNAGIYLMEGDIKNAAISAIAVIPGAGDAVAIGRVAHKGGKYLDKGKGIIDAATKGGKGSREIILEKEKTYERARNVLMEELDKTGRFKNGSKANFGSLEASYGYGKIIGRISYDKKVSWRLDYDPEKGVHFNIEDISNGKRSKRIKLAIPIGISEDEYRRIIDSWNGGQR